MTMVADVDDNQLQPTILNQLTYDCSKYPEVNDEATECLKETAAGREIARPLATSLMSGMFKQYMQVVAVYESSPKEYIRPIACVFYTTQNPNWRFVNQLMELLSVPGDAARKEKVSDKLNHLADLWKTPWKFLAANMTEQLQSFPYVQMEERECSATHFDNHLSQEAKAMFLLLMKIWSDTTTLTFKHWKKMSISADLDTLAKEAFKKNFNNLETQVSSGIDNLITQEGVSVTEFLDYLLSPVTDYYSQEEIDKIDETVSQLYYKELLQIAKYALTPLQTGMTEQGKVKDMQETFLKPVNRTYGKKSSFSNVLPVLLHCNIGNEKNNTKCPTAVTTFSKSGIGYSLNTEDFFKIYKPSPSRETFCQEINERTDQTMCLAGTSNDTKKVEVIKSHGKSFSMRLLLNTPKESWLKWKIPKLAIHASHSVPDTTDNYIEPSPGTHTTVVVTPHVTETDLSLLSEDKLVRGCHSQEHDGNPLKLYQNYTKDNCVFECQMKRSTDVCGCVPWNYPKLDEEEKTCSIKGTVCFKEQLAISEEVADCSHCLDECNKTDYEYTVHTKPMQEICGDDNPDIQKAVDMVVNDNTDNFLPDLHFIQEVGLLYHLGAPCHVYIKKNAALIDVHIGPANAVRRIRMPRVTFWQQLSNLGK